MKIQTLFNAPSMLLFYQSKHGQSKKSAVNEAEKEQFHENAQQAAPSLGSGGFGYHLDVGGGPVKRGSSPLCSTGDGRTQR
nr:hypothetical protein [Roseovarius sp. W115]